MRRMLGLAILVLLILTPGCGGKSAKSSSGKSSSATAAAARQMSVDAMWASARGQYGKVWAVIHPKYQAVTTRAAWEKCRRQKAAKIKGIEWLSFGAPKSSSATMKLPLLGSVKYEVVTVQARFKYRGTNYSDSSTIAWTIVNGHWRGLWSSREFADYKAGRCPK
jgi:hypothetical protein